MKCSSNHVIISLIQSCVEPWPILACLCLSLSRMPLSYPIMILSPATSKPVYLWNVPNGCLWSIHELCWLVDIIFWIRVHILKNQSPKFCSTHLYIFSLYPDSAQIVYRTVFEMGCNISPTSFILVQVKQNHLTTIIPLHKNNWAPFFYRVSVNKDFDILQGKYLWQERLYYYVHGFYFLVI